MCRVSCGSIVPSMFLPQEPEPPAWLSAEQIAEQLISGTLKPQALGKFTALAEETIAHLEALVTCNKQRQKTNEQIGREAAVILGVEKERAKRRQLATQNNNAARAVQATLPALSKDSGQARDKAGEKTGVSGKTELFLVFLLRGRGHGGVLLAGVELLAHLVKLRCKLVDEGL
jgi:hypothetical protein